MTAHEPTPTAEHTDAVALDLDGRTDAAARSRAAPARTQRTSPHDSERPTGRLHHDRRPHGDHHRPG